MKALEIFNSKLNKDNKIIKLEELKYDIKLLMIASDENMTPKYEELLDLELINILIEKLKK